MDNKLVGNLWRNCFCEPRRKKIQADEEISLIFTPVFFVGFFHEFRLS